MTPVVRRKATTRVTLRDRRGWLVQTYTLCDEHAATDAYARKGVGTIEDKTGEKVVVAVLPHDTVADCEECLGPDVI